ncbi:MAG: TolC family protein [Desulfobacteraceae bacterium]|nr:MAG: TolC family protein [Desulfobacteraceae bacterium]
MQIVPLLKRLLLFSTLFLSACSMGGVQKDFAALADRDLGQHQSWSQLDGGQQVTILGDLIHSAELEALVNEALAANPGLQQTLLTLRIRQAQYRQAGGDRLPEIDAGYAVGREKENDTKYKSSISISWEIDLWQKLSDNIQAAAKDVAEQQAFYQSAQDTLSAEVMKSWLGLTTAHQNITIEGRRLANLEKNEAFILQRYSSGLGTLEDLDSARSATASSKATLEGYREAIAQQERVLQTLLGRTVRTTITIPEEYSTVLIPLVELPALTLRRRPDLKAAYLAIEAASLHSDVAYKDLLPSINLQVALEDVATSAGAGLLTDPVWSLLAQLTAPLFHGGRLRAAAEIAELQTAQSYQVYRETLIEAVREIEDAIGLEGALTKQIRHIETALTMAQNNLQHYQHSYRSGLADILDLLTVQRQTYDLEVQLNNLIYERLANRINLGLALGLGVKQ